MVEITFAPCRKKADTERARRKVENRDKNLLISNYNSKNLLSQNRKM